MSASGPSSAVQIALVAGEAVVVALGLAISYLAYRGYRDHRSKPMLFLAAGFVLIVGGPALLAGVWLLTPLLGAIAYSVARQVVTIAGFVCIFYALWTDPSD